MTEEEMMTCNHISGLNDNLDPICGLNGLTCYEVLRYADNSCKFDNRPVKHEHISLFGDDD